MSFFFPLIYVANFVVVCLIYVVFRILIPNPACLIYLSMRRDVILRVNGSLVRFNKGFICIILKVFEKTHQKIVLLIVLCVVWFKRVKNMWTMIQLLCSLPPSSWLSCQEVDQLINFQPKKNEISSESVSQFVLTHTRAYIHTIRHFRRCYVLTPRDRVTELEVIETERQT